MIHFLDSVFTSRDPDRRREAWALCGEMEECSGSGKHSMSQLLLSVDCPRCRSVENDRRLREKGGTHGSHSAEH